VLKEKNPKLPTNEIFLKGTITAVIHFISMGFSFKTLKRIFTNKNLKNDI
jgi:arginine exporter protein ArgO